MSRAERSGTKKTTQIVWTVIFALCIPGSLWFGDELWAPARYWPADGIGFGLTVGCLLPLACMAAKRAFVRANSQPGERSSSWTAVGVGCSALAVLLGLAAARAIPGRGSSRPCVSEWNPCWINHVYPGAMFAVAGGAIVVGVVVAKLPRWTFKYRARAILRGKRTD